LGELLGGLLPADTQADLLSRAGGNPLYAEEFARALRERGLDGELPETIQGLIAARLDLLDAEQKALVQDAAVVGKHFWLGALGTVSGVDRAALEERLHTLERREFVRRERATSVAEDTEYVFRHVLVRDVAYRQIPRSDRAEKHLLAARWIEQLGRREDHAEMLAYHYLEALELTRALRGGDTSSFADAARAALADAGDRAFALNAYDVSARFYRAALDLVADDRVARGRLLLRLGRTLALHAEPDEVVLEQARDDLLSAGDTEGAVDAEANLCELSWEAGDRDRAFEHLDRARELADTLPASPTKARVLSLGSRLLMLASEAREAIRLGEEALAMAEQLGLVEVRAATLDNIGTARTDLGERERGRAEVAEAVELARAANAPWELVRAMNNLAVAHFQGPGVRVGEVVEMHRQVRDECARYGQGAQARFQDGVLVGVVFELGGWDEASSRVDRFLKDVEAGSPHYLASQCYPVRALIRIARGLLDAALGDVEQALILAERAKDPQIVDVTLVRAAYVLHEAGEKQRAAGLADGVLTAIEEGRWSAHARTAAHVASWTLTALGYGSRLADALEPWRMIPWVSAALAFARGDPVAAAEICAEIGAGTQEAYARLSAARLFVDRGRRAEADVQLERALAFYRSVGATRYVRQAESLLPASA
jgi:tetratricopeptide (TPR) repeat protein